MFILITLITILGCILLPALLAFAIMHDRETDKLYQKSLYQARRFQKMATQSTSTMFDRSVRL